MVPFDFERGPFWFSSRSERWNLCWLSAYRELAGNCLVQPHEHGRHRLICLHVQGRKASRALELGDTPEEQAAGRQADWQRLSIRVCRPVRRAQGADRTSSWTSERGTAAFVAKAALSWRPINIGIPSIFGVVEFDFEIEKCCSANDTQPVNKFPFQPYLHPGSQ